jgi:hypothetical protein
MELPFIKLYTCISHLVDYALIFFSLFILRFVECEVSAVVHERGTGEWVDCLAGGASGNWLHIRISE